MKTMGKMFNVISLIPPITDLDIINYLIFTKSAYTEEEFRAYKSLDAYRSFTNGNVSEFMLIQLRSSYTVIRAKVKVYCVLFSIIIHLILMQVEHSMKITSPPLPPWAALTQDGVIEFAHCTCVAGQVVHI